MAHSIDPFHVKDSVKLFSMRRTISHSESKQFKRKSAVKLPPLVQRTTQEDIKWQIKALPTDWEPNTKTSKTIAKFFDEKETQHDKCIDDMKNKMKLVNRDIEYKIRYESELLKRYLKDSENHIQEHLEKISFDNDVLDVFIVKETFEDILIDINLLVEEGSIKIRELHNFLDNLEKYRSEKFKEILRESYACMHELSYKLPYELQEYFEHEILNINQITLSNYRCYTDLNMQLNLKLENDKRLWLRDFYDLKETYIEKRKSILMREGPLASNIDVFSFDSSIRAGDQILTTESLEKIAREIAEKLVNLEWLMGGLKHTVEMTIEKIYIGNFDEIQNISPNFRKTVTPKYQLNEVYEAILNSLYDNPLKHINDYTVDMIEKWQDLVTDISEEYQKCNSILVDALHIWDKHFDRIFELKEITLVDLKKLMEKNANTEDREITKLNLLIDKLRQDSSEADLKETMGDIKVSVETIIKYINQNNETECNFFNKYKGLAEVEAGILALEMKAFLNRHKINSDVDPTLQRGRASRTSIKVVEEKPEYMTLFQNEIKALHNWMYGLHESVEQASDKCLINLLTHAKKWVSSQFILLNRKLQVERELNNPRFQRIYNNIYKVRLGELIQHEERLKRHKSAVKLEMSKLKNINEEQNDKYKTIMQEYENDLKKQNEKLKKIKHSTMIKLALSQIHNTTAACIEKINKVKSDCMESLNNKENDINYSTLEYMKHLKLFNEDGNYTPEELKFYKKELGKLEKLVQKESKPALNEAEKKHAEYLAAIAEHEKPIIALFLKSKEELEFHEMFIKEIKGVQAAIKKETYDFKLKYKVIESSFNQLRQFANKHKGMLQYLDDFTSNCEFMEKSFQDVRDLVHQEHTFKLNSNLFRDNKMDLISLSNVVALKGNMTDLTYGQENFNMILFESIPNGKDYMSKIINILFTSLTEVQQAAKEFYNKHTYFINEGIIINNLVDFMVDLLAKYLYYQLQCEEVWLEVAIDYMLLADQVHSYITLYYKESIKKYIDRKLKELKEKCRKYTNEVKQRCENIERRYRDIHNKLKPLHGFPLNDELLQKLNEEMVDLDKYVIDAQEEMYTVFEEFQMLVVENLDIFQTEIRQIEDRIRASLEHYLNFIIRDEELLLQIKNRIDYLKSILKSDYTDYNTSRSTNSESYLSIIADLNNKINALKKGLRIKTNDLTALSHSLSKILKARGMYTSSGFLNNESMPQVADVSGDDLNIDELVERFRLKQEKCVERIYNYRDLLAISQKWNILWQNDLERIKNLYSVKYSIDNSETDNV